MVWRRRVSPSSCGGYLSRVCARNSTSFRTKAMRSMANFTALLAALTLHNLSGHRLWQGRLPLSTRLQDRESAPGRFPNVAACKGCKGEENKQEHTMEIKCLSSATLAPYSTHAPPPFLRRQSLQRIGTSMRLRCFISPWSGMSLCFY